MSPPRTQKPETVDLHWAAGFLEGEGWFGYNAGTPVASAAQVNKAPLDFIFALFGGSLHIEKQRTGKGWKQAWVWRAFGERALGVMQTLWPLLSPKRRDQITVVIAKAGRLKRRLA